MKTKISIAVLGIFIAVAAAIRWKPEPPAPARASIPPTAANNTANSSAHSSSEHAERTSSASRRGRRSVENVQPSFENDPAQLLAGIQDALGSTNPDDREIVSTHLLAALVRADPLAAARFAETNDLGGTHDMILHRVAQLWAARDTSAALDWAAALGNARERDEMLTDIFLRIAESDPAEAVRTRTRYVPDEKLNAGLEALTQRWAERDFPAARDWALSRAAGAQRDQLIARMAFVQSQTSPIEAATLVTEKIPPGEAQNEAVMTVLHQWASRDLAAAVEWVARFSESDLRTRAVAELEGLAKYQSSVRSP